MPSRRRTRNRNSRPRRNPKKKTKIRSTQLVPPPIPKTQLHIFNPSKEPSKFQTSRHRIQDTIYDIFCANKTHFLWIALVQTGIAKIFPDFYGNDLNHFIETHPGYLRLCSPLLLVFSPSKQSMCPLGRKQCKDMKCPKIHPHFSTRRSYESSIFRHQFVFGTHFRATPSHPGKAECIFARPKYSSCTVPSTCICTVVLHRTTEKGAGRVRTVSLLNKKNTLNINFRSGSRTMPTQMVPNPTKTSSMYRFGKEIIRIY